VATRFAVVHSILIVIYSLLDDPEAVYTDLGGVDNAASEVYAEPEAQKARDSISPG
jgi:hypothetical protein